MPSRSKTPGKRPPPLPTPEVPDAPFAGALREADDLEEEFFHEGIDGRTGGRVSDSEADTIMLAPASAGSSEPETGLDPAEVEDPARARRRRIARIGVAWGTALMVGIVGTSAFLHPRVETRSPVALSASPAQVERGSAPPRVAAPHDAIVTSPPPAEQVATKRSPVRTASTKAGGATHARSATPKKGAAPAGSAKGSKGTAASPKRSTVSQTRKPSAAGGASKPKTRARTTARANTKTSS